MGLQGSFQDKTIVHIDEPKHYKVIMYNDDFTTMQFVVEVLMDIFRKHQREAEAIMLTVHRKGSATVGLYPYDIAKTKVNRALSRAKKCGYPFRMTVEEE